MVWSMVKRSNIVEVFGTTLLTKALRINVYMFLVTSLVISDLLRPMYAIAKAQFQLPIPLHVHLVAHIQTEGRL